MVALDRLAIKKARLQLDSRKKLNLNHFHIEIENLIMNQIEIYQTNDNQTEIQVRLDSETVWLSQKQMALLFDCSTDNISLHLKNIFKTKELFADSVTEEFTVTESDGKIYKTKHYDLDTIISLGYRINSQRATQFRQWATQRLKDYLVKGHAINQKRFNLECYISDL